MQEDFKQKEQFKILKEISSLLDKKQQLLQNLESEKQRVHKVQNLRSSRELELIKFQDSLKEYSANEQEVENQLAHLQAQLDQAKSHINQVQTQQQVDALTNEIEGLERKINQLEEDGMLILEKIDEIESSIQDSRTFLSGSLETLQEVTQEVQEKSNELNQQINILDQRLDALMQQLNPIFASKLSATLKKNIPISIFTRISGDCCDFCKLALSKVDSEGIEKKMSLTTCNGCHRIFIPVNSQY